MGDINKIDFKKKLIKHKELHFEISDKNWEFVVENKDEKGEDIKIIVESGKSIRHPNNVFILVGNSIYKSSRIDTFTAMIKIFLKLAKYIDK